MDLQVRPRHTCEGKSRFEKILTSISVGSSVMVVWFFVAVTFVLKSLVLGFFFREGLSRRLSSWINFFVRR